MITRTQVAAYVAEHLAKDRRRAVRTAAAWLQEGGPSRIRQAGYLARDVARLLGDEGYVYAKVTTARTLDSAGKKAIESHIRDQTAARNIELELVVDLEVIGGVLIELPEAKADLTVKSKLANLGGAIQ